MRLVYLWDHLHSSRCFFLRSVLCVFSDWSIPDNWNFNSSNPCLHVGGNYNQNRNHGLFYVNYNSSSNSNDNIGCRTLVYCVANKSSLDRVILTLSIYKPALCEPGGADDRTPHGEDKLIGRGLVHSSERWNNHGATRRI